MTVRVLVIGAGGFIGPHVVRQLIAGNHTVGVVQRADRAWPDGVQAIRADRRDLAASAASLLSFGADVVIDLILSSGRQAAAVLDTFRGAADRVVAISSIDVYRAIAVLHGSEAGELQPVPLAEDSELRNTTQTYPPQQIEVLKRVFGWLDDEYDKVAVEHAIGNDSALPATILRLPMVYGPGDHLHRLFPLLKRMSDGRRVIPLSDRVAQWRSPRGYVENVAAAIVLAATHDRARGRTYNVAEAESYSELEWARLVASQTGWTGELRLLPDDAAPEFLRIPGRLEQHWTASSERIRRELGYHELTPHDLRLSRTIEWERANPPAIDASRFDYEAEDRALMLRPLSS